MNIANTGDLLNKGNSNKSPSKDKKDINNNTAFNRKIKNAHDTKKYKNIQNTSVYHLIFTPME